jgi:hypothetical protein
MNLSLYALPVSTIIIGLSVSLIKFSEYIQNCCVSNTNLIIRQNDQIGFLLKRLIDLNDKIVKLELDFTTLSTKLYFTYDEELEDEELEDEELEDDELVASDLTKDELVASDLTKDELVASDLTKDELEVFEIIDVNTVASAKKTSWMSFLF